MNTHRRRYRWTLILVVLAPVTSAYALFGGFSGIVFDPANLAENVRQTVALLQQIDRATRQIELQWQMLRRLPESVIDGVLTGGTAVLQEAGQHFGSASAAVEHTTAELEARFPLKTPAETPGWLAQRQAGWDIQARSELIEQREFHNAIVRDMAPTAERVATIVTASNGQSLARGKRPGITAAAQAHNELLAICSVELDKLLVLRAALARARHMSRARRQTEAVYHEARRELLMDGWPSNSQ